MNCREYQDWISDAVDGRLELSARLGFDGHSSVCQPCRLDFEIDRGIKFLLQKRIPFQHPSRTLVKKIHRQLAPPSRFRSFLDLFDFRTFDTNPVAALVSFLVILVGGIALLQHPNARPLPVTNDILYQSTVNFGNILSGSIQPSTIRRNTSDLQKHFGADLSFDVSSIEIGGFDWCGGMTSKMNGIDIAQVIYKLGGEGYIYILQTDLTEAMKNDHLGLPENVRSVLRNNGRYFEHTPSQFNIVAWTHSNTLCIAVSSMEKDRMAAILFH